MPLLHWQYQSTTTQAPSPEPVPPVAAPPSNAKIILIVPTAIDVCLAVAENLSANLRRRQAADVQLPSLYKRAYQIAYETDELALVRS